MNAIQRGETLQIGFGSATYTGYVLQTVNVSKTDNNVEVNRGEDGETLNKIFMDPATNISISALIKSTGAIDPPQQGDVISFTTPGGTTASWCVESASAEHVAGATKLNLELTKEDSMNYTSASS
jgi:hypothetical protein